MAPLMQNRRFAPFLPLVGFDALFGADIAPLRRSDSSSLRRIFQPPEANLSLVRES